jgi:hypothetical protein
MIFFDAKMETLTKIKEISIAVKAVGKRCKFKIAQIEKTRIKVNESKIRTIIDLRALINVLLLFIERPPQLRAAILAELSPRFILSIAVFTNILHY